MDHPNFWGEKTALRVFFGTKNTRSAVLSHPGFSAGKDINLGV
jgi:hypothetical protein